MLGKDTPIGLLLSFQNGRYKVIALAPLTAFINFLVSSV